MKSGRTRKEQVLKDFFKRKVKYINMGKCQSSKTTFIKGKWDIRSDRTKVHKNQANRKTLFHVPLERRIRV